MYIDTSTRASRARYEFMSGSEILEVWQQQNQNSSSRHVPWDISKLVFKPLHLLQLPFRRRFSDHLLIIMRTLLAGLWRDDEEAEEEELMNSPPMVPLTCLIPYAIKISVLRDII